MDAQWYLLQSKSKQELRAQEHLTRQGYNTYLPMLSAEKIQRGKRTCVTEPLFPGYLFIHLCPEGDNWRPIRSTRGVTRVVGFNNAPLAVPEGLVETLIEQHNTGTKAEAYQAGDTLRIKHGPFKELDAVFCTYDGEARAIVLLNIMHTQQTLSLPLAAL